VQVANREIAYRDRERCRTYSDRLQVAGQLAWCKFVYRLQVAFLHVQLHGA
jgi:hypothetical protein